MKLLNDDFKIENLNLNTERSFSTIRLIIAEKLLYEKIASDDVNALAYLQLAMNGEGLSLGNYENSYFYNKMPNVFIWLNSFSTYLSFVFHNSSNSQFREIMEDTRMAIQNFYYEIQFNNIYDSLIEYRKVIEGALWFVKYSNGEEIDEGTRLNVEQGITSQLSKWPTVREAFKKISYFSHGGIMSFDINCVNKTKIEDIEMIILNSFKELSQMFEHIFESEEIKTSEPLIAMRKIHDKNVEVQLRSASLYETNDTMEFIKSAPTMFQKGYSSKEILLEQETRFNSLFDWVVERNLHLYSLKRTTRNMDGNIYHDPFISQRTRDLINECIGMTFLEDSAKQRLFNISAITSSSGTITYSRNHTILKTQRYVIEVYISKIKNICKKLLIQEIKGNSNWQLFYEIRVALSDYAINLVLRKKDITHSLVKIYFELKKHSKEKSSFITFDYKHINQSKRLFYVDSENRTTGTEKLGLEDLEQTLKIINLFLSDIE